MIELNKIYCADCLDIMKEIDDSSIDLVLTDPPYGITACKWDSVIDLDKMWKQLKRIGKDNCAFIFTSSQPFTTTLINSNKKMFKYEWIWVKNTSSGMMLAGKAPMKRHENILVFGRGKITFNPQKVLGSLTSQHHSKKNYSYANKASKLYSVDGGVPFIWSEFVNPHSVLPCDSVGNRDKNKVHPTQKPIALMEYLIKTYTNEGELVLDFTIGSGTTAIACINLNRQFIGIDSSEKYCKIARERVESIL